MKWITITELVDVDTGELISLSRFKREDYYKIKSQQTKTEYDEKNGTTIKRYTTECKRRGQTKLEF